MRLPIGAAADRGVEIFAAPAIREAGAKRALLVQTNDVIAVLRQLFERHARRDGCASQCERVLYAAIDECVVQLQAKPAEYAGQEILELLVGDLEALDCPVVGVDGSADIIRDVVERPHDAAARQEPVHILTEGMPLNRCANVLREGRMLKLTIE